MRKLFLSAATAALLIAGAASAQDVTLPGGYQYSQTGSPQVATANLANLSVGRDLTGGASAVGNSLSGDSRGNITVGGVRQFVESSQTSTLNVSASLIGDDAVFNATSAGNVADLTAARDVNINALTQGLGQSSTQVATTNLSGLTVSGGTTGGASAIANSITGTSSDRAIAVGGPLQQIATNAQRATVNLSASAMGGNTELAAQAVGNVMSLEGDMFSNYTIGQQGHTASFAGSSQFATMNVSSSNFASADLSAGAFGNVANIAGVGGLNANLNQQGFNSPQTATLNINTSGFTNLTGVASAVGNAGSITSR